MYRHEHTTASSCLGRKHFWVWQADGLQANIVTFNTLIDAMGKAGRWQDAIGVLDIIDQQVGGPICKHALRPLL